MIYCIEERAATIAQTCFVADSAAVIGQVVLEDDASVWFGAVLRGDSDVITVGPESNIQDGAILHTDPGIRLTLGRGVTVGHKATLHGCEIGDYSLVGIGAIVLNRARIGSYCIIGANALVVEGKEIPDRSLVLGTPGRVVRTLTDEETRALERSAQGYVAKGRAYRDSLRRDPRF
jgi:carbonic anhydrase/acetyltransferase-like protein (isoleucine patch superfamily)